MARLMTRLDAGVQYARCVTLSGARARSNLLRQLIFTCQVVEPCHLCLELETDGSRRAMTLLADDDLGFSVRGIHFDLPPRVLIRARPRLLVAEIILLAKYEQYDISVLLDGTRLA